MVLVRGSGTDGSVGAWVWLCVSLATISVCAENVHAMALGLNRYVQFAGKRALSKF